MASVNKVILVGNLGSDPEVMNTTTGSVVAKVSLATTSRYKDKTTGDFKEQTDWHRLVFWNQLAETVGKWLKKGSPLYVEGRIQYGQYIGNDGITRYTTYIVVNEIQMLGSKGSVNDEGISSNANIPNNNQKQQVNVAEFLSASATPDLDDDDIPF